MAFENLFLGSIFVNMALNETKSLQEIIYHGYEVNFKGSFYFFIFASLRWKIIEHKNNATLPKLMDDIV